MKKIFIISALMLAGGFLTTPVHAQAKPSDYLRFDNLMETEDYEQIRALLSETVDNINIVMDDPVRPAEEKDIDFSRAYKIYPLFDDEAHYSKESFLEGVREEESCRGRMWEMMIEVEGRFAEVCYTQKKTPPNYEVIDEFVFYSFGARSHNYNLQDTVRRIVDEQNLPITKPSSVYVGGGSMSSTIGAYTVMIASDDIDYVIPLSFGDGPDELRKPELLNEKIYRIPSSEVQKMNTILQTKTVLNKEEWAQLVDIVKTLIPFSTPPFEELGTESGAFDLELTLTVR